jgi:hypothetical protein
MSRRHKQREEVFAIVRWDGFHSPGASPEVFVTVKEIVRSQDLAEAEVARLNALCEGSDIRYWWQPTLVSGRPLSGSGCRLVAPA